MSEQQRERSFAFDWSPEVWRWVGWGAVLFGGLMVVINAIDYFCLWPETLMAWPGNWTFPTDGGERDLGSFGDFLGGVLTPLLTFLTFVGLLQSIHLQREELAATREELAASARAQEEQAEYMREQQDHLDDKKLIEISMSFVSIVDGYKSRKYTRYNGDVYSYYDFVQSHTSGIEEIINDSLDGDLYLLNISFDFMSNVDSILTVYFNSINICCNSDIAVYILLFSINDVDCIFFKKYLNASYVNKNICSDATKVHLETVVAFLEKHGRYAQPTP